MAVTDLGNEIVFPVMYVTDDDGVAVDADGTVTCQLHGPSGTVSRTVSHLGTGEYLAESYVPTVSGRYVPHYTCEVSGVARVWSGPVYTVEDLATNLAAGLKPNGVQSWSSTV